MKGRRWKLRRQRTRNIQIPGERFTLNEVEEAEDKV